MRREPLVGRVGSGYNFPVSPVLSNLRVHVLFFGPVRDLTGIAEESIELPVGTTLAELLNRYCVRFPKLAGFRASLVASQNQEFAPWEARVANNDTIAFLPPVSGG